MKATICDRCKKPFLPVKRGERLYTLRQIDDKVVRKQKSRGVEFDLCPKCYNEFVRWLGVYWGKEDSNVENLS